jgi:hypothetical protein
MQIILLKGSQDRDWNGRASTYSFTDISNFFIIDHILEMSALLSNNKQRKPIVANLSFSKIFVLLLLLFIFAIGLLNDLLLQTPKYVLLVTRFLCGGRTTIGQSVPSLKNVHFTSNQMLDKLC